MKKIIALILLLTLVFAFVGCGFDVPTPEIKQGEFKFRVTYELNGESVTLSGVYMCAFDGVGWSVDGGFHRDWVGYVKDGVEDPIEIGRTEDGGVIWLDLGFYPDYFMGDTENTWLGVPEPCIVVAITDGSGMTIFNEVDIVFQTLRLSLI